MNKSFLFNSEIIKYNFKETKDMRFKWATTVLQLFAVLNNICNIVNVDVIQQVTAQSYPFNTVALTKGSTKIVTKKELEQEQNNFNSFGSKTFKNESFLLLGQKPEPNTNSEYKVSIEWVTVVVGGHERKVIGVNGEWPIPAVYAYYGKQLRLHVTNNLELETVLHSHGLYQNGTQYYDGTFGVNQCGIPPGANFTYDIPVQQTGTYYIHGHFDGQVNDGLRWPLVLLENGISCTTDTDCLTDGEQEKNALTICDRRKDLNRCASEWSRQYDEEVVVTLGDWYHDIHRPLLNWFLSDKNPTGKEPIPDLGLIMGSGDNPDIVIEPGKTYLFRVIAQSVLSRFNFFIEGHDMYVVEVDGIRTEPLLQRNLYIASAQR